MWFYSEWIDGWFKISHYGYDDLNRLGIFLKNKYKEKEFYKNISVCAKDISTLQYNNHFQSIPLSVIQPHAITVYNNVTGEVIERGIANWKNCYP